MAYFLDKELAALTEGVQPVSPARILPNKFAKDCAGGCGGRVPAGKGRLVKSSRGWEVYHLAC